MSDQTPVPDRLPANRSALLSGVGFYKLSQRRRKQLSLVFGLTLLAQIIGLAVFGGAVIMSSMNKEVVTFRTPEPIRTYKPRKLEHKVKVTKRQRSSSRPSVTPRIVAMKVSDLALPEIKVDPKIINTTFQPKFKAVTGKGLGAGLGTGYGTSGFGEGMSAVNFFGIRARGERIAVCVDVSVSMVEEQNGGVAGYMRVKQRVGQVIDALKDGTLFNVIVFADGGSVLWDEMKHANGGTRSEAKNFLRPFNTEGHWGHSGGNIRSSSHGLSARGGTTRLDLALTAVFEQGADTVLVISDGAPRVRKGHTQEEIEAHRQKVAQWNQAKSGAVAAYKQASASAAVRRVWVPAQPARPARPARKGPPKEGQGVDRGSPAVPAKPGYWKEVRDSPGGRPSPPGLPDAGYWTLSDFIKHLKMMYEHTYKQKGMKPPVIHCIGYQIDKAGSSFLRGLSREYHGKYRRVNSIR